MENADHMSAHVLCIICNHAFVCRIWTLIVKAGQTPTVTVRTYYSVLCMRATLCRSGH